MWSFADATRTRRNRAVRQRCRGMWYKRERCASHVNPLRGFSAFGSVETAGIQMIKIQSNPSEFTGILTHWACQWHQIAHDVIVCYAFRHKPNWAYGHIYRHSPARSALLYTVKGCGRRCAISEFLGLGIAAPSLLGKFGQVRAGKRCDGAMSECTSRSVQCDLWGFFCYHFLRVDNKRGITDSRALNLLYEAQE